MIITNNLLVKSRKEIYPLFSSPVVIIRINNKDRHKDVLNVEFLTFERLMVISCSILLNL